MALICLSVQAGTQTPCSDAPQIQSGPAVYSDSPWDSGAAPPRLSVSWFFLGEPLERHRRGCGRSCPLSGQFSQPLLRNHLPHQRAAYIRALGITTPVAAFCSLAPPGAYGVRLSKARNAPILGGPLGVVLVLLLVGAHTAARAHKQCAVCLLPLSLIAPMARILCVLCPIYVICHFWC